MFVSPVNVNFHRKFFIIWENISLMLIEHMFQPHYKFLKMTVLHKTCACMCACMHVCGGGVFQWLAQFMMHGNEYLLSEKIKSIQMVDYSYLQTLFPWLPWDHNLLFPFPWLALSTPFASLLTNEILCGIS